jgi:hypothetical protein
MIGQVIKGGQAVATLEDNLTWTAPDAFTAETLNTFHSPANERSSPAILLPPGRAAVAAAAREMGGEPRWAAEMPPLPEGAVS